MCPSLQNAPLITALEQLGPHNHLCSIYESPQEHFGVAIPFIRIGLDRGDKCIYIADDDTVGDVRDVMQAEGIDVDRAAASKSLVIATKAEAYLNRLPFDPDWMLTFWKEATARAMSEGFPALRVAAETEWVLQGAPGLERWMQYESRLTRAVSEINCIALCQYNRRLFPSEVVLDVLRTHPIVVSSGTVCRNMYHVPADEFLGPDQASREVERLLINIREREQVEHHLRAQRDELRTSEHRFRLMVEGVKDYGLFMLDTEGRVISWNAGAERIKGYREEEILGQHFSRFYSPEEVAQGKIEEELRIAVTSGKFQGEGWRIRKDGSRFFAEFLIAPVRDEAGDLVGFLKLTRDITERKRAEASLREAQDRVEMIVNSITDNFFGLDKDWRFTYLNKHAQEQMKVLGKDPARLIGKVLWEEFPSVPNEEVLRRVMSERIVMIDELYYPPLGEWVENHIYPSPDGGLVTFQRYVTRRKRAERELLRSQAYLAEGQRLSHTGSWAWNVSSGELFWTPEVFRIFGVDPTNTPVSHSMCLQRIHSDDRPFVQEMFERAIRERAEYQADCRVIRPDGMIRHLHALGHPAFNESGDLIEYVGTVMDVTEPKQAEQELMAAHARITEILESITDAFSAWDKNWRYIYVNERAAELLGKPRDQLIGRSVWELFPEAVGTEAYRKCQQAMAERKSLYFEAFFPVLNKWYENYAYPTKDGLSIYWRDITERKRAEEERHRSEAYLAEAQRLSHTGSGSWNPSTGEVVWSDETYRIYGFERSTVKPSAKLFLQIVHPQDRLLVEQLFEKLVREGSDYELGFRVVRPDGVIKYIHSVGHPVYNESGDLIEYVGTVIDVTERKLAEDKLRRSEAYLAEGQRLSRTGSWAWNVATRELFWSDQQFRIFGLDPEKGTPSLSMAMQFIHPDDRSFVQQVLDKAVREKTDHEWDCRIVTTDGTVKYVHTAAHPVFESGQLMEYVGTTMDVTQRTQADLQLRQLSGRLLHLQDDERRRLARELHDSTGQTLTGLSLRLAVVEDEIASLSRGARQALAESASLLDQASRELRSLSYLLHPPFLDDSGLRSAVPWYVDGFSHRSGIQVQVDLPSAMGRLSGDLETTLFRIIQECLTNILKHSGSQTASLRILLNENQVMLEISDQGKGLPVEILDTPSNLVSGVGIGIMGMRERVRQLHGRLELTSGTWGTKVTATLPLNGRLG